MLTFSIVEGPFDTFPIRYKMAWGPLAQRLADHRVGDKIGTALICGLFESEEGQLPIDGLRKSRHLVRRELVALDIEEQDGRQPPDPGITVARMKLKNVAGAVWTTHSHTTAKPRFRIVMPLTEAIGLRPGAARLCVPAGLERETDRAITINIADRLGVLPFLDRGKCGASALMYLARHRLGDTEHRSWIVEGTPIEAEQTLALASMVAMNVQMKTLQKQALDQSRAFPDDIRQRILAYNDGHELSDLFRKYGYVQMGERWKSPHQHAASQAATSIYQLTLWTSFSESDKDAGLGQLADSGEVVFGDAFSLFLHYEHRGNFRSAIRAIGGTTDGTR